MSQGKLRVARQLVRDHFGPVTEAVAWTLLTKGRQTAGALVGMLAAPAGFVPLKRKLELSGVPIPPRNVREALFVLIQHNLATFAETSDNPNRPPVVYYSMSLEDVLARLRIPSIVVYVSERVSELAGAVIRTVFAHGRMSLEHLQSAAESDPSMSEYDPQEIRKAFNVLAHRGYLCRVNEESGVTTSDMKIKNENEALEEMGPIPRTKERAEALRRANEKTKQQSETHTNLSMKRKAEDDYGSSATKKQRVEFEETYIEGSDANSFWKVDLDRCFVLLRNEKIVEMVDRHVNETAAFIVRKILDSMTAGTRSIGETGFDIPSVTAYQIARVVPRGMDMLIEYPDGDSNVERAVGDYLELLSNNHPKILYRAMDRGGSAEYRVDFEEACTWLRLGEITRTIEAKFGIPSRRIWNIVHDKGKLDDKHVSKLGLLAPKEARERLYNLFRSKFLYMTAVPKGNDRSAQRTFFLYYTNVAKTSEILLNNVYATVAKLRNRYQHEMSRWEKLLSKIQRAEQEGEEILNEMDRRNKDNLDKIVDRLEIAERRLAEMTIILPE